MGISAIIPVHNEASVLDAVLECVESQSRRPDEIILVLDSCTDESEGIARRHQAKVVSVYVRNIAIAVMSGVAAASKETLVLFDGNSLVPASYVEVLEETLFRTQADLVEWHGGMMIFPRTTLERFGDFSPLHLWTLEFFLRMRERGGRLVQLDGPHVRLKPSPLRRNLRYGLDYAMLSERYKLAPFFRIGTKSGLLPDLFATFGAGVGHLLRGRLGRAVLDLPVAIRAASRSSSGRGGSDPPTHE